MWVIVVLLLIGGTIICVRLFRNAALEGSEPESLEEATSETLGPAAPASRGRAGATSRRAAAGGATASPPSAAIAASSPRRSRGKAAATSGAAWPGGACPACGSETVPSAKFCGECGHRLIT